MLDTLTLRAELAGRYALEDEIGAGGMANVYRARDVRDGRIVAIKLLRPELAALLGVTRFLREIHIEADLRHPNILEVLDAGEVAGVPYYVMPLMDGDSLRERLARDRQLPVTEVLRIAAEVGAALQCAHDHGIIHRDIKPDNILFAEGRAVVADFGIARAIVQAGGEHVTSSGLVLGTPGYMSPEQGTGAEVVDARSDQYSLACVVHEMLVGEPPFSGPTAQAIIARHAREQPPSIAVVRPGVPGHIVSAIERALQKVPADRWASVATFVHALEDPGWWHAPSSTGRRRWAVAAGLAAVAIGAWALLRPAPPLDANKVAVFPLAGRGLAPADSGAGYDVALTITAALEHSEPLKGLDAAPELSVAERADPSLVGAARARRVGRELRARYFVEGVVRRVGDSTAVTLRLHDAAGDTLVAQETATGAGVGTPPYRVGLAALRRLLPLLLDPGRRPDLSVLSERNPAAIALWIQGERLYRRGRFADALDRYRRAVEIDSALLVAAIKGAQAASWEEHLDEAGALARLALARDSLLPRRYALLARGIAAYAAGEPDTALTWLGRVLREEPDWAEASTAQGEVAYHFLPHVANPESLAEASFEHALAVDPTFVVPAYHLAQMALRRGDVRRADRYIEQFRASDPDSTLTTRLGLMRACVAGQLSRGDWLATVRRDPNEVLQAAAALTPGARQPPCAEAGLRALLTSDQRDWHWDVTTVLQGLLLAQGRTRDAIALVDSVAASGSPSVQVIYLLDALAGAPVDSQASAVAAFLARTFGDSLQRLRPVDEKGARTRLLLGTWYATHGRPDLARAVRATLGPPMVPEAGPAVARSAAALDAHLALLGGDTAAAIRQLRALRPNPRRDAFIWRPTDALPVERLRLAQLLLATGKPEEALQVAQGFDHPQPLLYVTFVPASLELRRRAAEALGRADLAATFLDRERRLTGTANHH